MTPLELGTQLIWAAHQMKPGYVVAGMTIARLYCLEHDLDSDDIERIIISIGAVRGGSGTYQDAQKTVHTVLS